MDGKMRNAPAAAPQSFDRQTRQSNAQKKKFVKSALIFLYFFLYLYYNSIQRSKIIFGETKTAANAEAKAIKRKRSGAL